CSASLRAGGLTLRCGSGAPGPVRFEARTGDAVFEGEQPGHVELQPDLTPAVLTWLGALELPAGEEPGRDLALPRAKERFDPELSLTVSLPNMDAMGSVAPFAIRVRTLLNLENVAALASEGTLRFGDEGEEPATSEDALLWIAARAVERRGGGVGIDRRLRAFGPMRSVRAASRVAVERSEFFPSARRCDGVQGGTRISLALRRERSTVVVYERLSGAEVVRRVFEAADACPDFATSLGGAFYHYVDDDAVVRWLAEQS
ncbi:MAG: hypothetical protein AAF938_26230, partial [Myxococcota bacterium]